MRAISLSVSLVLLAWPALAAQQKNQNGAVPTAPVTTQPSNNPFDATKNTSVPPAASRRNQNQNGMTTVPLSKK